MTVHRSPAVPVPPPAARAAPAAAAPAHISFAVVLYFLMIALPIQFHVGPIYMTGLRAVLLVTTVPLCIRLLGGHYGRILPTDWLLLIYLAWGAATLSVNSPDQAITIGGAYFLELFGGYVLARACVRTPEQFRAMCRGLFAVLIFTIPFAIYETQTGRAPIPTLIAKIPGLSSHGDYDSSSSGRRLGLLRSQVIFSHPIHYGLFCASLISLALVGLKGAVGNFWRRLLGVLITVGVIASVSSGAILPMIMQFSLMAWAWLFRKTPSRWTILTVIVVVCYVTVDLISNRTGIEVLLAYTALSAETAYGRIIIFRWGMVNVWNHPFLGIGLNDWVRPAWLAPSVDNFWLLSAMRYGIPGFVMLAVAYLSLVWKVMRRDLGGEGATWQFRRAWVFTQVSMILTLCTVDVWATALSYVFFLLGAGAWLMSAQPVEAGAAPETALPDGLAGNRYTRFAQVRARPAAAEVRS